MSTSTKPKVAILDDYAAISPAHFQPLVDADRIDVFHFPNTLNPHVPSGLDELATRLAPFQVICCMRERTPFRRELLTRLPELKVLLTTGPRNAGIDLGCCRERGVVVAGTTVKPNFVPGHSDTNEQHWALLLALAKNLTEDDVRVKNRGDGWQAPPGGSDGGGGRNMSFGLAGRTLGLLGFGRLGLQCAVTAIMGFGMKVVAWSPHLSQDRADESVKTRGLEKGCVEVLASKEELMGRADVLSMQLVLSDSTRGIVGRKELALMKKNALLVNMSRGPLIDEDALIETLRGGRIRGAAIDVFETEPLPPDSPWRDPTWGQDGKSHVVLSPHTGYVEEDTMHWMYRQNAENVERWLKGEELTCKLE